MPRHALLAAAALLAAGPARADTPDAKKYGWHDDYAAARAEAKRAGKPLMVVFRCEP